MGIEKLDPSEHERWVAEREIADALREFLREISQVHSFLKTRENELKTCRLSRIIFKNYQDALRKFLNGATDFQWDGFPEIVQAIKLLKLKRIARVSGENRTIVWGVGK